MSRYCVDLHPEQKNLAAQAWRERCLLAEGSVFTDQHVWTTDSFDQLDKYYSRNIDEGSGDFYQKLEAQLRPASSEAKRLAAEMLWLMLLCPSNISPEKKREGIVRIWGWSGSELDTSHPLLADEVLDGIGSGGTGFNTNRWRELAFLIELVRRFKDTEPTRQRSLLADGWRFAEWLGTVPGSDARQLPFMMQYLLYPDDFERIFAGTDRRSVVAAFTKMSPAEVKDLPSVEIDRLLRKVRQEQEVEHETKELDFYFPPLSDVWRGHGTQSYLLTWNPDTWPWETFAAARESTSAGKSIVMQWSCANTHAKVGDHAFLLRTGKEPRGIIARGNIVRAPYQAEHLDAARAKEGATRSCVDVEFTSICDPAIDSHIPASELAEITVGDQEWFPQSSGIIIKPRPAARLEKLWQRLIGSIPSVAPEVREPTAAAYEASSPTNLILYGPPGTGKTYRLKQLFGTYSTTAEQPTEAAWLQRIVEDMTWWEVIALALDDLARHLLVQEIFEHRAVQAKAKLQTSKNVRATIWGALQNHARADSSTVGYANRTPPLIFDKTQTSEWFLVDGWHAECPQVRDATKRLKAGPAIEGEAARRFVFVTFHQSYGYEDFVEGIRPQESDEGAQGIVYRVVPGVFRRICLQAKNDPENRYAIFIDEINRGNIAKILGELITLVEADKRAVYDGAGKLVAGLEATLPYSGELFGVPRNLDVIATMNTADRSIALLDTALRRRFRFEELMPESGVISGADGRGEIPDGEGGLLDLRALLDAVNRRMRFLLHRDQTLGHAYFTEVKTFVDLRRVLIEQVIPLLQEYFYEDWQRIQLVFRDVGQNGEPLEPQIICHSKVSEQEVLGIDHEEFEDSIEYWVAPSDEITPDAIRKIYETT